MSATKYDSERAVSQVPSGLNKDVLFGKARAKSKQTQFEVV